MKSIYTIVAALAAVTFLLPAKAQAQERFIDNSFINAGAGINVTILHPLSPKTWGDMAFGVGLLNEFKICKQACITLDLMAIATNPSVFTTDGGRAVIFPTATVGVSFNLGEIF